MPFVAVETIVRGVQAAVVTGTLSQWRDAVVSGCSKGVPTPVRHCFNKLHGLFIAAGLNVWGDFTPRSAPDQTFLLLEDKQGPLDFQFRPRLAIYQVGHYRTFCQDSTMQPFFEQDNLSLYCGDLREVLPTLPEAAWTSW